MNTKRTVLMVVALAALPLVLACSKAATQGEGIDFENLYFEEVKAFVAALEHSVAEVPDENLAIVDQIQQTLGNSDEEDIGGYEDKFTQMTALAQELEQLFKDNADADQTTPKVSELVTIAKSLPGKDMPWDSYYEFPGVE